MIKHNEPMHEYLASNWISVSDLKLALKSPYHFSTRDQISRTSDALSLGTLVHTAILEPAVYAEAVIAPDLDKRTRAWKDWKAEHEGRVIVTADDAAIVDKIRDRLKLTSLAELFQQGDSEVSAYAPIDDLMLRARADKFDPFRKVIVDLKTTRDLQWFHKDVYRYGYDISVPHYKNVFAEAKGTSAASMTFVFVAVETEPPYDCGWFILSTENEAKAHDKWTEARRIVKECNESSRWDGFTTFSPREI